MWFCGKGGKKEIDSQKMKNTLEILNNYLERAVTENLNQEDFGRL